jgi:hypothetical protein
MQYWRYLLVRESFSDCVCGGWWDYLIPSTWSRRVYYSIYAFGLGSIQIEITVIVSKLRVTSRLM